MALAAKRPGSPHVALAWAMVAFVVLRCALLLTLDNSEPRYTLEFFPLLIVWASFLESAAASDRRLDALVLIACGLAVGLDLIRLLVDLLVVLDVGVDRGPIVL